ncbi:hypothetical protein RN2511_042240 [Rhodococcus sp. NKCM2511]|nr:hypothetical protein RN2511_042240 [Rhodococcus sp. NKCM2511]
MGFLEAIPLSTNLIVHLAPPVRAGCSARLSAATTIIGDFASQPKREKAEHDSSPNSLPNAARTPPLSNAGSASTALMNFLTCCGASSPSAADKLLREATADPLRTEGA